MHAHRRVSNQCKPGGEKFSSVDTNQWISKTFTGQPHFAVEVTESPTNVTRLVTVASVSPGDSAATASSAASRTSWTVSSPDVLTSMELPSDNTISKPSRIAESKSSEPGSIRFAREQAPMPSQILTLWRGGTYATGCSTTTVFPAGTRFESATSFPARDCRQQWSLQQPGRSPLSKEGVVRP